MPLKSNSFYTILVKYNLGSRVFSYPGFPGGHLHEGGVFLTFKGARYSEGETGIDNSNTGPLRDFYFVLQDKQDIQATMVTQTVGIGLVVD